MYFSQFFSVDELYVNTFKKISENSLFSAKISIYQEVNLPCVNTTFVVHGYIMEGWLATRSAGIK